MNSPTYAGNALEWQATPAARSARLRAAALELLTALVIGAVVIPSFVALLAEALP